MVDSNGWTEIVKRPTDKERATEEDMGVVRENEGTSPREVLRRKIMPFEEAT